MYTVIAQVTLALSNYGGESQLESSGGVLANLQCHQSMVYLLELLVYMMNASSEIDDCY